MSITGSPDMRELREGYMPLRPHPMQVLLTPHQCTCPNCRPERFPSGPPQQEGHIAHRFGAADFAKSGTLWETTLDGVRCLFVSEACPSTDETAGFVVMNNVPLHQCQCGVPSAAGVYYGCQHLHTGDVQVRGTLAAPSATTEPTEESD